MLCALALFAALVFPRAAAGNGADLPPEIILQGFVKPEAARLLLVLRVPLDLLASFPLPKRGPGYLDLTRIDDELQKAAAAAGRQIQFTENGVPLVPAVREVRISVLSDRSFASYASALAHVEGAPLPPDTELFWNQGFMDVELAYPIQSAGSHFAVRVNVAPELGRRLKLRLQYLPADGPAHAYELPGGSGWIALDPTWNEAAWLFLKAGFGAPFALDRLAFMLCLLAPFRQVRSGLVVVLLLAGLQALTLTAVANGIVADSRWLAAMFDSLIAGAIVLFAIGNLSAPRLSRRWFLCALVGALGGFGIGHELIGLEQFAGLHTAVSKVAFNVGVVAGEVASFFLAQAVLRWLFDRVLGPPLGVVVLSVLVGQMGLLWMMDRNIILQHESVHALSLAPTFQSGLVALRWLVPTLLAGAIGIFLPWEFGGEPIRTLRAALFGRDGSERGPGSDRT